MADRLPYPQRRDWILQHIAAKKLGRVDVLNSDFVVDYAEHTQSKSVALFFGAPRCRNLGADLGRMHQEGYLERASIGIGDGLSGQGFPKWVYVYHLSDLGKCVVARNQDLVNG